MRESNSMMILREPSDPVIVEGGVYFGNWLGCAFHRSSISP